MNNKTLYAIFTGFVIVILAGQILSYVAEPYRHEVSSWDNGMIRSDTDFQATHPLNTAW